jgi:hypothetical protein
LWTVGSLILIYMTASTFIAACSAAFA